MGKYASKVVEQAKAWLGRKEADGTHKLIIDVYNSQRPLPVGYRVKYNDAWCATFASAVFVKLGYTDIVSTECSCPRWITLLKKDGMWVEDESVTPKAGWLLFYDWDDSSSYASNNNIGSPEHVGIVEKVSGGYITVIEGNYSNSVKRRTISLNGRYIRGYGVPKYDAEAPSNTTPLAITQQPMDMIDAVGKTVSTTVNATGDGLSYAWYYKNKGASKFSKTDSFKGNAYTVVMSDARNGRQIYCVITDEHGNSVTSNTVTIKIGQNQSTVKPDDKTESTSSKLEPTVNIILNELRVGSEGEQVKAVQRMLYSLKYYSSTIDGSFGSMTGAAVRSYQKKVGLTQDGVVGANTWKKLLGVD
jgi:hypothetical protein